MRQYLAVALASASVFMMGGAIFGASALYPVLYSEGALVESSCGEREAAACAARRRPTTPCCAAEHTELTVMSTVAFFASDASIVVYGEIKDRAGPRACFALGALLSCDRPASILLPSCARASISGGH